MQTILSYLTFILHHLQSKPLLSGYPGQQSYIYNYCKTVHPRLFQTQAKSPEVRHAGVNSAEDVLLKAQS